MELMEVPILTGSDFWGNNDSLGKYIVLFVCRIHYNFTIDRKKLKKVSRLF